jgi:hypothetical protein
MRAKRALEGFGNSRRTRRRLRIGLDNESGAGRFSGRRAPALVLRAGPLTQTAYIDVECAVGFAVLDVVDEPGLEPGPLFGQPDGEGDGLGPFLDRKRYVDVSDFQPGVGRLENLGPLGGLANGNIGFFRPAACTGCSRGGCGAIPTPRPDTSFETSLTCPPMSGSKGAKCRSAFTAGLTFRSSWLRG